MKSKLLLLLTSVCSLTTMSLFAHYPVAIQPINPEISINQVWTEHNVMENGKMGIRIHVNLDIAGLKNKTCQVVAYFYHENGYPVRDQGIINTNYRTADGNVSTLRNITPPYESANFPNLTLFIPYEDLHLVGNYRLKYMVSVFYYDLPLVTSNFWEVFELRTNTNYPLNNQIILGRY